MAKPLNITKNTAMYPEKVHSRNTPSIEIEQHNSGDGIYVPAPSQKCHQGTTEKRAYTKRNLQFAGTGANKQPEQGVGYTIKENSGLDLGIHTLVTENIIADSLPNDVKGFKLENILLPAQPSVSRQKADVTKCGRRMFVAALICASKFVMDRTYSNKAWSKVTGLDTAQINLMEFEFLKLLNYKLYVSDTSFNHWKTLLNYCRQNNNLFKCHKISSPSNSFTRSFSTPDYKFAAPSLIPDASKKPLNIITNTNLTDITTTNTNSANYSIIAFASSDRKIHC
ncbi:G1/S-specific cyclin pas1 [Zancudomyces culisetae]|uniref:G1/S-specific cyclin pas1 n=1 Tax=Zancudomyces culisetae TaxID=1213189 RepID=A0A1R1PKF7_ZANCU|nr:G1/S-specific cyclin pas1 [Zancudomyces culisetae]|eukprot:OMH81427.1 G1/S-specific cyclin pas1 [Zancudomyces culisetae]